MACGDIHLQLKLAAHRPALLPPQVKRVVIIGTSVVFFGTTLTMKTKMGGLRALSQRSSHHAPCFEAHLQGLPAMSYQCCPKGKGFDLLLPGWLLYGTAEAPGQQDAALHVVSPSTCAEWQCAMRVQARASLCWAHTSTQKPPSATRLPPSRLLPDQPLPE